MATARFTSALAALSALVLAGTAQASAVDPKPEPAPKSACPPPETEKNPGKENAYCAPAAKGCAPGRKLVHVAGQGQCLDFKPSGSSCKAPELDRYSGKSLYCAPAGGNRCAPGRAAQRIAGLVQCAASACPGSEVERFSGTMSAYCSPSTPRDGSKCAPGRTAQEIGGRTKCVPANTPAPSPCAAPEKAVTTGKGAAYCAPGANNNCAAGRVVQKIGGNNQCVPAKPPPPAKSACNAPEKEMLKGTKSAYCGPGAGNKCAAGRTVQKVGSNNQCAAGKPSVLSSCTMPEKSMTSNLNGVKYTYCGPGAGSA